MDSTISEKYKVIFLQTAGSYLKKIQEIVVTLLKDPNNNSIVEDAYLASHSLKSEFFMMQYKEMANFFLILENLFKGRRDGKFTFTHEILILINDEIEKIIKALPTMVNEHKQYEIQDAYTKLQKLSGVKVEDVA